MRRINERLGYTPAEVAITLRGKVSALIAGRRAGADRPQCVTE
jgi:hypothetical protein